MRLLENWQRPWAGEVLFLVIVALEGEGCLCLASDGSFTRLRLSDVQTGRPKPMPRLRLVN